MRLGLVGVVVVAGCRIGFDAWPAADADGVADGIDVDAPPPDYCAHVPALATAPTIDGTLEPGLALQMLVPVGWQSDTTPLPPLPDVPVQLALGYRSSGLYFFLDVSDPDRFPARPNQLSYCGDGVELYADHDGVFTDAPSYDSAGTVQFVARAPATETGARSDGAERFVNTALLGAWQSGFAAFPRPGGYTFEAVLDAAALSIAQWTLAPGGRVGFDVSINVSRPDGAVLPIGECSQNMRLGQFYLRIDESAVNDPGGGAPWSVPTAFCVAQLD